ncbi:phosphatase PAP2 family protein [Bifidobacterium simiiventris]|uniref:phosphatase PAP2 family protein n=1 Tax=Bifidobacterium simiiventris TaxID=2834434 RepID=UPI001C591D97|nr:phosphatase PAP2 family protein [Bifidobacterium simiiventris]MBW3079744.1 phosphatase PAP2 family protein [Bifidobacterium simiiventris]
MTDEQQPLASPPTSFVPLRLPEPSSEPSRDAAGGPSSGAPAVSRSGPAVVIPGIEPLTDDPCAASSDVERVLSEPDPLLARPRVSSRILCVVFGLLLIAAAFGVWWLGVRTETGQSYDEIVVTGFDDALPGWLAATLSPFIDWNVGTVILNLTVLLSLLLGAIAVIVTIVRKRWLLLAQSVAIVVLCYASTFLKELLPRPYLIDTQTPHANSAPSGHTMLAAAASVLLLIAVPRVWRAVCAVISAGFTAVIGLSVIAGGWHRPTDAAMSVLLVGGWTLIVLAFTAKTAMDRPGSRVSSASIQIVGTVMITAGLLGITYAAYVIWQVLPGLALSAAWSASGAYLSTIVGVNGVTLLTVGLILAMRQLTAAPLSRLGLIGAPPAPPKQ